MKDAFEPRPHGVVSEDDSPHRGAIQSAAFINNRVTELFPDSVKCGRARGNRFSCYYVGIDDWHAKVGEKVGNGRLANGNAAGETDSECRVTPGRDGRVSRGLSP